MPKIRDYAATIITATTAATLSCDMPEHNAGDLLLAFLNKDSTTGFTSPAWTLPWTQIVSQNSAGANQSVFGRIATSSADTGIFTYAAETSVGVVVSVKNVYGISVSESISVSAIELADDTTLPIGGNRSIITSHSNCLMFSWDAGDIGMSPSAIDPWINLFVGDTGANGGCLSYTFVYTPTQVTGSRHWTGIITGVDMRQILIAVRDDGNNSEVDCHLDRDTLASYILSPLSNIAVVDRGIWTGSLSPFVNIGGKATTYDAITSVADAGYNPFRAIARITPAASTTNLAGSRFVFTNQQDFTSGSGLIFGTTKFTIPRDYVDIGFYNRGGAQVIFGSGSSFNVGNGSPYRSWMVAAQDAVTSKADKRMNYLIDPTFTGSMYAQSGSIDPSKIKDVLFLASPYYGASDMDFCELWILNKAVIGGGTFNSPFNFIDLELAVNNGAGYLPLFNRDVSSATIWIPLQFGGAPPCHVGINFRTFQFPRQSDGKDYLDFHVPENKIGIEFYGQDRGGNDVDTFKFRTCVFTSDNSYYWRFNNLHASASVTDFTGSTVVNAFVTLKPSVTLNSMTFVDCNNFIQSQSILNNVTFQNTKIVSDNIQNINECIFNSNGSGSGHAIEITRTGSYQFSGNTFSNYGLDNTTDAAVYNNSGGPVTMSIVNNGDTPTVRTGSGATTLVQNLKTLTFTGIVSGTEVTITSGSPEEVIFNEENGSGSVAYLYNYVPNKVVDILIFNIDYHPTLSNIYNYTLLSNDASIPIQQIPDNIYYNP